MNNFGSLRSGFVMLRVWSKTTSPVSKALFHPTEIKEARCVFQIRSNKNSVGHERFIISKPVCPTKIFHFHFFIFNLKTGEAVLNQNPQQ